MGDGFYINIFTVDFLHPSAGLLSLWLSGGGGGRGSGDAKRFQQARKPINSCVASEGEAAFSKMQGACAVLCCMPTSIVNCEFVGHVRCARKINIFVSVPLPELYMEKQHNYMPC